ncbi:MAG: YjbE family putative metal transport protein [Alphaproteobacteria bacterium]|nr:YjbE family putative metal transport protein [Alphaproteobacteria bacterium]
MFGDLLSVAALTVLGKVILIDLMLAGDNVVILGTLAAQLPRAQRGRAMRLGLSISLIALIGLAFVALQLLKIIGLLFVGGVLLLWVAWKLFRELTHHDHAPGEPVVEPVQPANFSNMIWQVTAAELSMSLENVLAVAGIAHKHPLILFAGLAISVAILGFAANMIAGFIERNRWLAFLGVAMILYVALGMIWDGWWAIRAHTP